LKVFKFLPFDNANEFPTSIVYIMAQNSLLNNIENSKFHGLLDYLIIVLGLNIRTKIMYRKLIKQIYLGSISLDLLVE
jgi:hypothetical protein